MKKISISLILSITLLSGCMPFIASQFGLQEANKKYTQQYDDYKQELPIRNAQRQNDGLPAEPLKEYKDWLKEQPLKSNEIKVFKSYGVISPEEAKEIREREKANGNAG